MTEVTAEQAAEIIGVSYVTIHRRADDGTIPSDSIRREGKMRKLFVDLDALRQFAQEYGYRFDEALAHQYTQ